MTKGQISHHLMHKAMTDAENCDRCIGCGRIADSEEGEPWIEWLALPPGSDLAVRMGMVKSIPCPACAGTGKATS